MLWTPPAEMEWSVSNVNTRPAAAYGTSCTPGSTKVTGIATGGGWYQVFTGAQLVNNVWGLLICFNSCSTSATARNTIVDVGVAQDGSNVAGGYTVVIPNLVATAAAPLNVGSGGVWYYFPLRITAGSSVAIRAISNTLTAFNCWMQVFGLPRRPDVVKAGTYVTAFGITEGQTVGTTVTAGTTSDGTYTSLGTTATEYWWWQVGMGINDTTMSANVHFLDLAVGDASNKRLVIENQPVIGTSAEQLSNLPIAAGNIATVDSGRTVYTRLQCSGTADSAISVVGYGLGGG